MPKRRNILIANSVYNVAEDNLHWPDDEPEKRSKQSKSTINYEVQLALALEVRHCPDEESTHPASSYEKKGGAIVERVNSKENTTR